MILVAGGPSTSGYRHPRNGSLQPVHHISPEYNTEDDQDGYIDYDEQIYNDFDEYEEGEWQGKKDDDDGYAVWGDMEMDVDDMAQSLLDEA